MLKTNDNWLKLNHFIDGTFGLLRNLYSTVNIYRYVQKSIEIHILQIEFIQR